NISLDAFRAIFSNTTVVSAIQNSLKFSLAATIICLALSTAAALVALRGKGAARVIVDYIVNIPIAVPAILFGMAIFVTFALGPVMQFVRSTFGITLYGSSAIIVAAYVVLVLPHGTRLAM